MIPLLILLAGSALMVWLKHRKPTNHSTYYRTKGLRD